MAAPIPFLVVGDFPGLQTGLSRILTDLLRRLHRSCSDVFDLAACGWVPWQGLPRVGIEQRFATFEGLPAKAWAFARTDDWGVEAVIAAYRRFYGDRRGVIFSVWDPARCFELSRIPLPVERWGYFAVDGENLAGRLPGGPATEAVRAYDRVLGYTKYGADLLQAAVFAASLPGVDMRHTQEQYIPHLPHGIDPEVFHPRLTLDEYAWAGQMLNADAANHPVLGCVAVNQRRKDFSLFMRTLAALRQRPETATLRGWIHTDKSVSEHWSIPQLALDCDIPPEALVITTNLSSRQLAVLYSRCVATLAPGRGEGWGYPIVESLACGAPVAHVAYAGGGEITPVGWRLHATAYQPEGLYGVQRPVINVAHAVTTLARMIQVRRDGIREDHIGDPDPVASACCDMARKYDWEKIWPAWEAWFRAGVTGGM